MARKSTKQALYIIKSGLVLSLIALQPSVHAQSGGTIGGLSQDKKEAVIEPEKQPEPVHSAQIDTEHFELGAYVGVLNVEDFNSNPVMGLSFVYHINDKFIAQALYGSSTVSKATFEKLSDSDFLADEDRNFRYLELLGGYKLLGGRSFFGSNTKVDSDLYLNAGFGQVNFADNSETGLVIGGSYRLVMTDWMTMSVDIRDHIFNREFIGDSKVTHNTEFSVGINALF
ncbi:outer membrane beta-barrel protein [Alteromonadaceae bacterium Bs31]|nr:outer membrane beta-barrel protein [Alteromonadaceae bacterium Bs31]